MTELVLVSAADCRDLRARVLRPGQPALNSEYELDEHPRALHAAVRLEDGGPLVAVGSLLPHQLDPTDAASEVWRIRGMAVDPEQQGKGYGTQVLGMLKAVVEARGGGVWANVRTPARAFYAAQGFEARGQPFELPGIGPHVLMCWRPGG